MISRFRLRRRVVFDHGNHRAPGHVLPAGETLYMRYAGRPPCRIFASVNGSRHAHEITDFVGSLRPRRQSVRIPSAPPGSRRK